MDSKTDGPRMGCPEISSLSVPAGSKVPDPASAHSDAEEYDSYFQIQRGNPGLLEWTRTCLQICDTQLRELDDVDLTSEERLQITRGILLVQQVTLEKWAKVAEAVRAEQIPKEQRQMVTVMEVWHLKPGLEGRAAELMQQMDDLVGPPAHEHPGWCGHARFWQSAEDPCKVLMVYPWKSRRLHEDLTEGEDSLLADFMSQHCSAPREIRYYSELPVEVEHEHDESHPGQVHGAASTDGPRGGKRA